MLNINDYNHLKLLYDKFLKANQQIKNLVLDNDWESVDIAIQEKESLLRQIIHFEKPRIKEIKANSELYKLRLELIELEKENIVLIKDLKNNLLKDLTKVKKVGKVLRTYEPFIKDSVSTIDIKDDE